MLQFQVIKLLYHQISIRLKIIIYKKLGAIPHLTGGQTIKNNNTIQAVNALPDLCQHMLNTCTVLDCVTLLKFHMLQ